jgi:hypothetical protein
LFGFLIEKGWVAVSASTALKMPEAKNVDN